MRQFDGSLTPGRREHLLGLVQRLVEQAPQLKHIQAAEYLLEPPTAIAVDAAHFELGEGDIELALSRPTFRPPFEWIAEITSNLGEADYFKHYLITDQTIMLALRRDLWEIDDQEADIILADLELIEGNG